MLGHKKASPSSSWDPLAGIFKLLWDKSDYRTAMLKRPLVDTQLRCSVPVRLPFFPTRAAPDPSCVVRSYQVTSADTS